MAAFRLASYDQANRPRRGPSAAPGTTHLARLVAPDRAHEAVGIGRGCPPVVRLAPVDRPAPRRAPGASRVPGRVRDASFEPGPPAEPG